MSTASLTGIGLGALLVLTASAEAFNRRPVGPNERAQSIEAFNEAHPGAAFAKRSGRIRRVFGQSFSQGPTAADSAESFRLNHAEVFGVRPQELVPAADDHVTPVMYQPETGTYKFTRYSYTQQLDGVPVYGAQLKLLVRNEPGYPLVLASADLRDLGGFQVDAQLARRAMPVAAGQAVRTRVEQLSSLAGNAQVASTRTVIWAGVEDQVMAPRLAAASVVDLDVDQWLVISDAATGVILYEEQLVLFEDIVGTVDGVSFEGLGPDFCETPVAERLPYLKVTAGANSAFTDINGDYVISNPGTDPITVSSVLGDEGDPSVGGMWFDCFSWTGPETSESVLITPPGPADLTFNAADTDATVRAQVTGYYYANVERDWVLQYHPTYPTLATGDFDVKVNRTDGFCPGNAFYRAHDPIDPSINFCKAGGPYPNTAYRSVLYHEYGHHLVHAGGSGQGAYGEGMSDVVSVLILDNPILGEGLLGTCGVALRNADNTCQYTPGNCSSCGLEEHDCGNLLSGCVWSTKKELEITEGSSAIDIIAPLALNSILLHTGTGINPLITIDFLTLDDDDADILNGTPHYDEINTGFSAHGMPAPEIVKLQFDFPNGLPTDLPPSAGTVVRVEVSAFTETPVAGTGKLVIDTGGGFTEIDMDVVSPNVYDAVFPATTCGDKVDFYFSSETTLANTATSPTSAPTDTHSAVSMLGVETLFADDFETDTGWSVTGGATDGQWDRGTPIPLATCDRGNPGTDADGSGQCYLTDNSSANLCNSDVDGGFTILLSPIIDATEGVTYVRYWRWYSNTRLGEQEPEQDTFLVAISDNGGSNFTTLEEIGVSGPETDGGWFQKTWRVADYVSQTTQLRMGFLAEDANETSIIEAAIDGFELFNVCATVPEDIDGDGIVGVTDLLIILGTWGPCPDPCPPHCQGDIDQDCNVGVGDLLAVLGAWTI